MERLTYVDFIDIPRMLDSLIIAEFLLKLLVKVNRLSSGYYEIIMVF